MTKPKALRLADTPFALRDGRWNFDADDELRRLHIVNQELVSALYEVISLTGIDRREAEEKAYELLGKME
jgi:hypothetical protein